MNITRRLAMAFIGAGALATVLAPAAFAQTVDGIKSAGKIKIGMLVDFPPFGIMNTSNEPDGYDADVAKLLAKELGVEAQIVPVTGPNRIPYLQSGQVDVLVASLGITEERAKSVDFSQPYAGISIGVFGPKDIAVAKPEDLSGKTIGVARASTQDTAVTKVAPQDANIRRFDDDASAVQALLSGQVELIGLSNVVAAEIEKAAPGRYEQKIQLSQQVQGIAVRKGSAEMLEFVNKFIEKAKSDGELNKIHEKWLGAPLPDFVSQAK
ncbi:polar amino acid transport system substrate-binding protein [Ochrobactrum intermedium]|uniref:Polar amino acid transport system substrate-binding protein n=1 Tax=Brucella intermedia TaxID=94625 RepID=A0ABR6ANR3_9HYPH|nr:transporter substrate-binding domain-containing protein [Brucella intermedia]KAB2709912.1 transporter substrate-binding domain-containing protein [Brucella intermedia]MBA8850969.1 polar amino acid transport system substrate-binding protein [Brucella intermedia]MCO7736675.1 transporter substrate-binding domain-containing protein [Brucella intermedia]NYD83700.1 polar amino acid transport system substrate-binding protein [Brucella intermedia]UXO85860.1 transporter substrate-binding domain-cont